MIIRLLGAVLFASLLIGPAEAHEGNTSFLTLVATDDMRVRGEWDFELQEMHRILSLDRDASGSLTWGEILDARERIDAFLFDNTRVFVDDRLCIPAAADLPALVERGDARYLRIHVSFSCPAGAALSLDHSRWFAFDPTHRALVEYRGSNGVSQQAILNPIEPRWQASESTSERVRRFFVEGMRHLVTGTDHLAFLCVLLIALVRRESSEALRLAPMLQRSLLVITAFTVAHSITLALAATGHIRLPAAPVEATIAASVLIGALANLHRATARHGWKLAFAFGLVHGLGFASALSDLASDRLDLIALGAFNLGIELAQVAVAALFVPLLWALFRYDAIARIGVPAVSLAIAVLAAGWLDSRMLG